MEKALLDLIRKSHMGITVILMHWDAGDWQKNFYDLQDIESYFEGMTYTIEELRYFPHLRENKVQLTINVRAHEKTILDMMHRDDWKEC